MRKILKWKKLLYLSIAVGLVLVAAWMGLKDRDTIPMVDTGKIKEMVEEIGGFDLIGLRVKPKRSWKASPEWEAYKLLKENYQGFPVQIKEKLKIIFDWTATEIIMAERKIMILEKEMRFSKKRFFKKIIDIYRRRKTNETQ
jgi:hypothetical protein